MKFSLKTLEPQKQPKLCLIVGIFEGGKLSPAAEEINQASKQALAKLIKRGGMSGKVGQTLPVYQLANSPFEHIVLVGCGNADNIKPMTFRKIIISAIKALNSSQTDQAVCYLTELEVDKPLSWKVRQIVEATSDALYRFDLFKRDKDPVSNLNELMIYLPNNKELKDCETALKQGQAIADSVSFTKNLANTPSNICTPAFLAAQAKDLAKKYSNVNVKILEENDMKKLGMGALLGVAQGSAEDAKLICLEYKGNRKNKIPTRVGKGVTFDTGGNSLKSPDAWWA